MDIDGHLTIKIDMDGYGGYCWIWVDMDGYWWIWVVISGYGCIWVDMFGYGWIWVHMGAYGWLEIQGGGQVQPWVPIGLEASSEHLHKENV